MLSRDQVLLEIEAAVLVDDSLENAIACVSGPATVPVFLFGGWEWNRRHSHMRESMADLDDLSFAERQARGMSWHADTIRDEELPKGIERTQNWPAVVEAARRFL